MRRRRCTTAYGGPQPHRNPSGAAWPAALPFGAPRFAAYRPAGGRGVTARRGRRGGARACKRRAPLRRLCQVVLVPLRPCILARSQASFIRQWSTPTGIPRWSRPSAPSGAWGGGNAWLLLPGDQRLILTVRMIIAARRCCWAALLSAAAATPSPGPSAMRSVTEDADGHGTAGFPSPPPPPAARHASCAPPQRAGLRDRVPHPAHHQGLRRHQRRNRQEHAQGASSLHAACFL